MELPMKNHTLKISICAICFPGLVGAVGCAKVQARDLSAEAPPNAKVVKAMDVMSFKVDRPERFALATAIARTIKPELVVTGAVMVDTTRNVPVTSLAAGRVVAIHARIGDVVKKGQILLSVRSDDIVNGYSDYKKSMADELLARTQLVRSKDLYAHGAIATNDLEVAENAENKAKLDMESKAQHLRLLGGKPERDDGVVDLRAPVSGVITDQQVTNAAGLQGLGSTAFTISDISQVWVVCDVYERDLSTVRVGDDATIHLNAYPGEPLVGKVSNIGAILDPNLRTAKVRIEVKNPGMMRLGMFVTANFKAQNPVTYTAVPASAVLRLHDRDWAYLPTLEHEFRRVQIVAGGTLPEGLQEIRSGLSPGQAVVKDAMVLDRTIEL
jgi:cobalt-zinc-cadmium efflux system membrane fusion protein